MARTEPASLVLEDFSIYRGDTPEEDYVHLRFQSGEEERYQLKNPHVQWDLNRLPAETAQLIRDFTNGEISIQDARQALGIQATLEEKRVMERLDDRLAAFLQEAIEPFRQNEDEEGFAMPARQQVYTFEMSTIQTNPLIIAELVAAHMKMGSPIMLCIQ